MNPQPEGRPAQRRPPRRIAAVVVTGALAGGLMSLGVMGPAEARVATDGTGAYLGAIDWFEWGEAGGAEIPGGETTRTNVRTIGDHELATTCTLSGVPAGELATYVSGSWFEDGLDDMYNIGGTDTDNTLVAGIANKTSGAQVSFGFDCDVTLDGAPVPLGGLVFADAEASERPEHIEATATGTWRLIDRHKSDDCDWNSDITRSGQTLTLGGREAKTDPVRPVCASFPTGVMFMEGTRSADVTIKGRGVTAVALGVVLHTDFGDAPESYGDAGALYEPGYTGGEIPEGTQELFDGETATPTLPGTRLGAGITSEGASFYSADARGDDLDDAASFPSTLDVTPHGQYTLPGVACTGPGFVAGWIDWNDNGVFDDREGSTPVVCAGSTVDLTWTVPADAQTAASFARLRIGPDAASVSSPTGLSTAGEVEDYAVDVEIPALAIAKTSNATVNTRAGDTVTYTVTATNTGDAPFTSEYPAVVSDDMTGMLDDAEYNDDANADRPGTLSYAQPRLSWSGPVAAGDSVTLEYTTTVGSSGDGTMRNVAFAGEGDTPICDPPTAEGTDPSTGVPCAETEALLPRLTITKVADAAELHAIGDTVTYTVTVTNTGPGAYTAEAPAKASDDWSDVLDDASLTGGPETNIGDVERTATGFDWEGALAAGESAVITSTFRYDAAGDHRLVNEACIPEASVAVAAEPCADVTIPGAALSYSKSSDPGHGTAVDPGDQVRYTLTFTNEGETSATVNAGDDLSRVLDDAEITVAPEAGDGLTAHVDGSMLSVTGSVPVGATRTVTYTVTVKPWAQQSDHALHNVVIDAGGVCSERCEVDHPITPPAAAPAGASLAITGGDTNPAPITVGAVLLALGAGLLVALRRSSARRSARA